MNFQYFAKSLILLMVLLASGCRGPWSQGWKYSDLKHPKKLVGWGSSEEEPQIPRRVLASWTDTVLYQTGKTPQRGFGGRVIFYGEDNEKPVLVDGQLVVYAFDEANRDPTDNRPTRRYVFPPDQVARRMSETALGPSYSFWLPWDEVGGEQKEVSLIVRFEPKGGAVVVSEQTRHLLPGEIRPSTAIAHEQPSSLPMGIPTHPTRPTMASLAGQPGGTGGQVQLASYEAGAEAPAAANGPASESQLPQPERRMTTTSISLPENFRMPSGTAPSAPSTNSAAAVAGPPAGSFVLPGNTAAQPQAPPPNMSTVAAPMSYPAVSNLQGVSIPARPFFQPPSASARVPMTAQSPLGGGFVAPLTPASVGAPMPVPQSVGRIGVPPAAPAMMGQPPMTTASGWATVTYQPVTGSPDYRATTPPSSGYPPQPPPAPATPVSR